MFVIVFYHRVYVQTIQRQKMFKKILLFNHLTPIKIGEKKINNTAFRYFMTILLDRKVQFIKFGKVEKEDVQSAEIEIGHNSPKAVKRINKPP